MKIGNATQIHIIGSKKTGKTTLIEFLIKELMAEGYKVGALKHSIHDHPLDREGSDTDRAKKAGANPTVFVTNEGFSAVYTGEREDFMPVFETIYRDSNYILVESCRDNDLPKIVIDGTDVDLKGVENVVAVINSEGKHDKLPAFKQGDKELIKFILEKFPAKK